MRLKGKKALITGGSQGIGLAIAKKFIGEGAQVVIVGRSAEKLKIAQAELGPGTLAISGDISKMADLDRIYQQIHEKMGNLDILVANAGISEKTPFSTTTEADFDRIISINLKGVYFTVQKAIPYFNEGGSILLIASVAALQGVNHFSIYSASKAAVVSLAKSFAAELLPKNIRVNSISPGVVFTPLFESLGMTEEYLKEWKKVIPMQRLALPEEMAGAAVFLASQEGSYITATNLPVDGGIYGISPL